MNRVVVIGSINVDLVVEVPHLPSAGETVLGTAFARHFGGKGANQAVAAARAGASVFMLGAVGNDRDGDESLAALIAEGIDVTGVARVDAPTGVALITVAPSGDNQIAVAPGANGAASDREMPELSPGDVLLASLEVPMDTVAATVRTAARNGATIVVNPAPAVPLSAELLACHPILTPNEGELLTVSNAGNEETAFVALAARGASAVIVTRGEAGATLVRGATRTPIAPRPVRAVDTTGAGDTFSGVLAMWLAAGHDVEGAARAANAAAGLSVMHRGARDGMPNRAAIEAELRH